ncbi:MAG: hypothetical protein IKG15_10000 [Solobacterium sp.]|nr:hypothetical protein [Solobacterium sp.]
MIFRDAIRALKFDKPRTFFYWLTFFLTTLFIFLFFNILFSNPKGAEYLTGGTDMLATGIIITVVIICLACIQNANDFYVRSKGKDIAVRMVCGATFNQVTGFLLVQTMIIMITSIPVGILCGMGGISLLNFAFRDMHDVINVISVSPQALLMIFIILMMVVIWSTMINLSFTYTNAAFSMMSNDGTYTTKEGGQFGGLLSKIPHVVRQIFYLALFIIPLILIFTKDVSSLAMSILGLLGLNGIVEDVVSRNITKSMNDTQLNFAPTVAGGGFLRKDLRVTKGIMILFIACAVIQISILSQRQDVPYDQLLFTFSYVSMNILLPLTIMFRLSTDQSRRRKHFRVLYQIGFLEKDLRRITIEELVRLYLIIGILTLLYVGVILLSIVSKGMMSVKMMVSLILFLIIPLLICMVVNIVMYQKAVLKNMTKPL